MAKAPVSDGVGSISPLVVVRSKLFHALSNDFEAAQLNLNFPSTPIETYQKTSISQSFPMVVKDVRPKKPKEKTSNVLVRKIDFSKGETGRWLHVRRLETLDLPADWSPLSHYVTLFIGLSCSTRSTHDIYMIYT